MWWEKKLLLLTLFLVPILMCSCQSLGDDLYVPCTSCRVPHSIPPGYNGCYHVSTEYREFKREIEDCKTEYTVGFFGIPINSTKCQTKEIIITVPSCALQLITIKPIKTFTSDGMTVYDITSPSTNQSYPDNVYCFYNISGEVTYVILDLQLQPPASCDAPGCNCPDAVRVTCRRSTVDYCGQQEGDSEYHYCPNGIQVTFCSDYQHNDNGLNMMIFKHLSGKRKRLTVPKKFASRSASDKITENHCDAMDMQLKGMSQSINRMGCQYQYMMRMEQPMVECPSIDIIKQLLEYNSYLMNNFTQDADTCSTMNIDDSNMRMMNKVERCAVEYLYRTRDCTCAKLMRYAVNQELRSFARLVVRNAIPPYDTIC